MMTAQRIQVGQVWRKLETGETFLVTKLYNEALATIAVLRPTGAATESMIRIRVDRQGGTQGLPGFSMAQENIYLRFLIFTRGAKLGVISQNGRVAPVKKTRNIDHKSGSNFTVIQG